MRSSVAVFILAALVSVSPAAQSQEWRDETGRLSFDATGSIWSIVRPPEEEADLIFMLLPTEHLHGNTMEQVCMVEIGQPISGRTPSTQLVGNEMTRLAFQLEGASGEQQTDDHLLESDGVLSAYNTRDLVDPRDGRVARRARRIFFLAHDGAVRMHTFTCIAYASAGEAAAAGLQPTLERLRISAEDAP